MDIIRAPTMRKKKPGPAGEKEDRASWVVHKPPAEMPPRTPRAAEGSAQEAGSQPPEELPPSASTEALPTPRLFKASESAPSDSIGHPAPPAKTYSEIVGILEEAGAAPVAAATPSSAQRQPEAASGATSAAVAFNPEQRYNAARAGAKPPVIPPLGLSVARSPSLAERVSSGIGGLLGGLGGLLLPKGEDAAPVLTKEEAEEAAAVRIQARLPPSPLAQTPPPALTPSAALTSHPPAAPPTQARMRANEARREVRQWAEAEIGFTQLPAVRRCAWLVVVGWWWWWVGGWW